MKKTEPKKNNKKPVSKVKTSSNKSKIKLTIPKDSKDTYTIIAKDKAGNTTKVTLDIEYFKKINAVYNVYDNEPLKRVPEIYDFVVNTLEYN